MEAAKGGGVHALGSLVLEIWRFGDIEKVKTESEQDSLKLT
jgi:hypothetical protein